MAEAVSSVVTDIVKGYAIVLEMKSPRDWRIAASIFTQEMCAQDPAFYALKELQDMKLAFLDGQYLLYGRL